MADDLIGFVAVNFIQQAAGCQKYNLFPVEILQLQAGNVLRKIGNGQVQLTIQQHFVQGVVAGLQQMHLHPGVLVLKLGDQLGHQGMAAGVGNANAQAALLAVGNVVEFLFHAAVALLKIQGILQKHLPGIGQFQGHMAHKQRTAQFFSMEAMWALSVCWVMYRRWAALVKLFHGQP